MTESELFHSSHSETRAKYHSFNKTNKLNIIRRKIARKVGLKVWDESIARNVLVRLMKLAQWNRDLNIGQLFVLF